MSYIWPADPHHYGITDNYADHLARGSAEPGVDIATPVGTPLKAIADGYVYNVSVVDSGAPGLFVTTIHPRGVMRMLHMSDVRVHAGQKVKQGDILGLSGNSGSSLGPHVHVSWWEGSYKTQPPFKNSQNYAKFMKTQEEKEESNTGGAGGRSATHGKENVMLTIRNEKNLKIAAYGNGFYEFDSMEDYEAWRDIQRLQNKMNPAQKASIPVPPKPTARGENFLNVSDEKYKLIKRIYS